MIACQDVSKYYGAHAAVDRLSFCIGPGQVVGLLGLNGAGKTTTLRLLSGLLSPTSGRIKIDGLDMAHSPQAARAALGFLPEQPPLYSEMTVASYLRFVAHIKGVRRNASAAVERALAATDLQAARREVIATLSHGYRCRVGIAQAIVHGPKFILLDEPTAGLDPVQVVHMRRLIGQLRGHHTIMLSSHILGEVHRLCDRIFVMHDGRIVAQGGEQQLAAQLHANVRVKICVRGKAPALEAFLTELPCVVSQQIYGAAQGLVRATVELQGDKREALSAALVHHQFGVHEITGVETQLEQIFLRLTSAGQKA